ncbi:N2,N2-dimethylguanosine tRNA methyltransferase [Lichtheimia hyalospora FSU 10163]|nr:N2,N2-dimethylguanosine tRNA methyltransferase [Lichtheimia hyalospora FSU 10163]
MASAPIDNATASPEIDLSQFTPVTEGKATILFPKGNEVFYNPVQEFNRDMSVAAIRTWSEMFLGEKRARIEKKVANSKDEKQRKESEERLKNHINTQSFTILEALAASGLRSIRYAKEIPYLKQVTANDLEAEAVESIKRNMKHNDLSEELLRPNQGDAMQVMYSAIGHGQKYDVVDLDPYGSAAPFIDGAVQAVSEGGLLCVTCTDLAILTGSMHPETCFGKYNGMPLKGMFPHEMALRLVLNTLQTSAGRYRRYIVPLMSCSIDFYLRVFVRVFTSPAEVKKAASKTAVMYECSGCHAYSVQPLGKIDKRENGQDRYTPGTGPPVNALCDSCNSIHHVGGPAWGAALHDQDFVKKMLEHVKANESNYGTHQRMKGMLTVISEEVDAPLYWTIQRLTGTLHCNSPPLVDIFSAILNAGYKVSTSHCGPGTLKTNAPSHVVWDVFRTWIKDHPVVMENIPENSPARAILKQEPTTQISFARHKDAYPESRSIKIARYPQNPAPNWGPKARAGKKRKQADA